MYNIIYIILYIYKMKNEKMKKIKKENFEKYII